MDWEELSLEKQSKVISDDIERVSWDRLPWLTGWTYRAVYVFSNIKEGDDDKENTAQGHFETGEVFTVTKVVRQGSGKEGRGNILVELVSKTHAMTQRSAPRAPRPARRCA